MSSWVADETAAGNNLRQYSVISSPGSIRSAGVAILYRPSLHLNGMLHDDCGRFVVAHFSASSHDSTPFQVVNIYGPNRRRLGEEFFEHLLQQVDPSLPTILCGDFNTVVDADLDRSGCNSASAWAYNWPRSLQLLPRNLTWLIHGENPTRCSASILGVDLMVFRFLASTCTGSVPTFTQRFVALTFSLFFRSDHSYVFMSVRFPSTPSRGPGTWKLNSSLLADEEYTTAVKAFWVDWQKEQATFPSLAVWWDAGKARIRNLTREYSKQRARRHRSRLRSLENTLYHLDRRSKQGDDVHAWITEIKAEIEVEHLRSANGARVRSREQWAEEGERSTGYFFRLEKSRATRRLFTGIKNARGTVVRSVSAILRVWCLFYVHLFTACALVPNDQDFFIQSLDYSLPADESRLCDGDVTIEECEAALGQMKSNKSPGVDGLPYEFYRQFWSGLGVDLVSVFNDCLRSGRLPFSQRTGLITLLYKKGDKLETKNWRPISLLCTDYKLLSKVLTNCLVAVISSVVGPEQVCGVPGRLSSENIRLLADVVNLAHRSNTGAALISLDQEKAFDRVDWSYMLRVLEVMNFGESYRSWVQLLYTDIYSQVLVNDYCSDLFPVTRGVRQGCPLSPLLYVLVAESPRQRYP